MVRGYLAGSGWKEYQNSESVCGIPLRSGYEQAEELDEPIFTPATKAETGHDENIPFSVMEEMIGPALAAKARERAARRFA